MPSERSTAIATGLSAEAEERMRSWLLTPVNSSRPPRDYKLAEFGLDAHVLRERFRSYTDTFGIEIEHFAGRGADSRPGVTCGEARP